MMSHMNNNNTKILFDKNRNYFAVETGDLIIAYIKSQEVYILKRTDNKPFNNIDELNGNYYGELSNSKDIEKITEQMIDGLCELQKDPNITNFTYFNYEYNNDKTKIIIFPIYEKENKNNNNKKKALKKEV